MAHSGDDLRRLREQVYGRDPDPAAVARYAAALAEAARTAPPEPDPEQPLPHPRRTRLPLLAAAGAVVLVTAAAVATGLAPRPQPTPSSTAALGSTPVPVAVAPPPSRDARSVLREQVLGDPAHLAAQDYFAFFPIDLPKPFGEAGASPVGYPNLHGTADLSLAIAPKATRALVLVTCADRGIAYAWTVLGRYAPHAAPLVVAHGGGVDCHTLDSATVALAPKLSDVHLVVTVPDDVLYAVSIYEH